MSSRRFDELSESIADLRKKVESRVAPQLGNSSFDAGPGKSIDETDPVTGRPVASFGTQFDGTHGAVTLTGPTPPTPTAPSAEGGAALITAGWDGTYINDAGEPDLMIVSPMGFSHTEVHAAPAAQGPEFDARTADTLIGTLNTARGGVVTTSRAPGDYYVRLVARNTAGKAGAAGPSTRVTVAAQVDPAALEALRHGSQEIRDGLDAAADELVRLGRQVDTEIPQQINEAAASPITDSRLPTDGSLTRWPFATGTIPAGALEKGAVGANDIQDFSILARKLKTTQHILY